MAAQFHHLYKKPRDGQKPPKVILKKGVFGCNRKFSIKKANHYIFWLALIFRVGAIVMRLISHFVHRMLLFAENQQL